MDSESWILDRGSWRLRLAAVLLLIGVTGCSEPGEEPDPPIEEEIPAVTITGDHGVEVGAVLELEAVTFDGTDVGYQWTSSNDAVAAVDAAGVVSGVATGEASVMATGDDTGASAAHAVVVVALPDEADPVVVDSECSKCHAGREGFHFFLDHGVGAEFEPVNGLECATCHTSMEPAELVVVDSVLYPSGIEITDAGEPSNLCATCHSGREARATVDAAIDAGTLMFLDVHYNPAAAVQLGAEARVGYEYDGRAYAGRFVHPEATGCGYCHDAAASEHTFDPGHDLTPCQDCHPGVTDIHELRVAGDTTDWDGDGAADEPLADEIATVADALLAEIQLVAVAGGGEAICYDTHAYPYFFNDSDGSGDCDAGEAIYPNLYADWTPALMKATFNYQLSQKDAAAWAHNFDYMLQLLIDSVDELGGDVGAYTRP